MINLKEEGEQLDFLGYTFRYDRDRYGRNQRYWNVGPSAKALLRERAKLHEMTNHHRHCLPLQQQIAELNRHLRGWGNYFNFGYPRKAFRGINAYVTERLTQYVRRKSQRPMRPPEGVSYYRFFREMGLLEL